MYIPKNMKMENQNEIFQFLETFSFGTIVSEPLEATHLPFYLNREVGEFGTLYSHMARVNPHWENSQNCSVLIIFSGPHCYISPSWYENKPAVPTWNYAAVHVYGQLEILESEETQSVLDNIVSKYEPSLLENKETMPVDYQQKLSKAIVAFKIKIDRIEAKQKLGQHRRVNDQRGVVKGLQSATDLDSVSMLDYMQRIEVGTGK